MPAVRRLLVLLLVVNLANCAFAAEAGWQAGAAKTNITPDHLMWMAGYGGRDHPAEGKLIDLWAKALVLEDAHDNRGVIITLDLVGIGRDLSRSIGQALQEKYGLERRQIAICVSHTHCGPAVGRNLGPLHYLVVDPQQRQLIDDYAVQLQERVVALVGEALDKLAPSELAWGNGTATFAVNRRTNVEAQVPALRTAGKLLGPFDHDVPVLAVRNAAGEITAVLFGYACHATVMGFYQWSGDYPGFAQLELEAQHPGCVAMFFAGCGADQNPLPRRTVELSQHYGERLATAVDAVLLTSELTPVAADLNTQYAEIDLPLAELPTREQIEQEAASDNKFVVARAKLLLDQLADGRPLSPTYPYPIAVWRLGSDIQFIALGGEVVVDYAIRLKSELRGPRTWVAGYAHDVMAYIPSRRVLTEGGYEGGGAMVYYGLPTVWAPEVEEAIVREVHRQAGQ